MKKHDEKERPEEWERLLRQGLDQVSDLGDEQPPELANLQMLVAEVQREQRRSLYADLFRFWAAALLLLTTTLLLLLREPYLFLLFQGTVAVLSLMGALVWYTGWRRVAGS